MTKNEALSVIRAFQTGRALFITDAQVFDANDALIDAGDFANAARLQRLAHLHPAK